MCRSLIVLSHIPADQAKEEVTSEAANLAREVNDAVDVIFQHIIIRFVDGIVENKLIVLSI